MCFYILYIYIYISRWDWKKYIHVDIAHDSLRNLLTPILKCVCVCGRHLSWSSLIKRGVKIITWSGALKCTEFSTQQWVWALPIETTTARRMSTVFSIHNLPTTCETTNTVNHLQQHKRVVVVFKSEGWGSYSIFRFLNTICCHY